MRQQLEKVAEALRKNNMAAYCVDCKEDVPALVAHLLSPGDMVAVGGSQSLEQAGVMELLRSGAYRFLDRYQPDLTPEQVREIYLESFRADAYLASSNAVTLSGELYNVDGRANRVAALCYGPRSVILVVGCNKIVADLEEAQRRVKTEAAPPNASRLHCDTYCAAKGSCLHTDSDFCTEGCHSSGRICCTYVTMGYQREAERIKVILVGEPLGF